MHTVEPHQEHLSLFRTLFRGRDNAYALHWTNPLTGKSGYKPLYGEEEGESALTDDVLAAHLGGDCLIGIYPLLSDNTCYFLAIDLDKDEWLKDACSLIEVAKAHDLTCYLERSKSGNGGHLWFFFDQQIPAWKARQLGKIVLHEAGLTREQSFDRMFPSQDEHTGKGLGNLIALPLNGKCLQDGNTAFITLHGKPHFDQWEFLSQSKTNPREIVDYVVNQCAFPEPEKEPKKTVDTKRVKGEVETTELQQAKVILGSSLFFPVLSLPDKLYKFLRRKLVFQNPMYMEQQRRGYSTWRIPRWIFAIRRTKEGVEVPVGFLKSYRSLPSRIVYSCRWMISVQPTHLFHSRRISK